MRLEIVEGASRLLERPFTKAGVCIAAMLIGLVGCQEPPSVRLFNNSGRPLVIHLDKGLEGADRLVDDLARVPAGESKRFLASRMRGQRLFVTIGACGYRYAFPPMAWNNPWGYADAGGNWVHAGRFPVEIQVDGDLTIYLRAPAKDLGLTDGEAAEVRKGRGILPIEKLKSAQGHGFPLKPISSACA